MKETKKKFSLLDTIERVGNKLPHPYILFLWLCLFVAVISAVCSWSGVSVVNPTTGDTVVAQNLLSADGLNWLLNNLLTNFQNFTPLGLVLAMQMAIGFAENTGLLTTALRKAILGVPLWALTGTVLFLGINGSIASEAAIVFVPALAATAFKTVGMHPVAGLLAGYAATNAGFTACMIVSGTDALLAGVTEAAAQAIDPSYKVLVTDNWYFMMASTVILTITGVIVNKKCIVPRLKPYNPADGEGEVEDDSTEITPAQSKGLRAAGLFSVVFIALLLVAVLPKNGIFRGEEGKILNGTLITGIVPILIIYFILVGLVYGLKVGTVKKSSDVPAMMAKSLEGMTGYIALVFIIAQFINMFNYTNLSMILAVKGSELLQAAGFTGVPLMLFFILMCTVVNLFMTSGTAKWYIFAPILVPMMMMMGFTPEFAQVVYRIGDSSTNAITPIYPYIPIAIGMAKKYDKNFGMGSLISMMLPYALAFLGIWIVQLIVWMVFNLPLGPGAYIFL